MKEKLLMTSFYLGNFADAAITMVGINQPGFRELNQAADNLISNGGIYNALVGKMAIVAVLTGIYALTASENGRFKWPVERAMQIGNVVVWGAVAWNTLNVGLTVVEKLK